MKNSHTDMLSSQMPQPKTDSKADIDRHLLTAHSALCMTSVSKK